MKHSKPILSADLLVAIDLQLINLLRGLTSDDWSKETLAPNWKIKDIAAHLLDGNLRTLSMLRDQHHLAPDRPITDYKGLVNYLDELNAEWISASKRLSPTVLIDLLEYSGSRYCHYLKSLNPFDTATFAVAWAGEKESPNWFHIAREYTEKWHHQQQIRLAIGKQDLLFSKEFYFPYLDTSMRALPHHYRIMQAHNNTSIHFHITGEGGGDWYLRFHDHAWHLDNNPSDEFECEVFIEGSVAWRIFTKGITPAEAEKYLTINGQKNLGLHILHMLAVMA